jgi:hypothetical protein
MADPEAIHCIANYRVSAFFYRYRRDVLGMDEAEARADLAARRRVGGIYRPLDSAFLGALAISCC